MTAFFAQDDGALDRLPDEEVIAYIRAARDAGRPGEARRGLQILVYGYWDRVERRVRMKVPEQYAEQVAGDAFVSALSGAFDGTSVGEFRAWLHTIADRRIADFHRRRGRPQATLPLDAGGPDAPAIDPPAPSEEGLVEVDDAVARVLGALRPDHRRVVELLVLEDRPTAEALACIDGMTESNAHQIVRRFRTALRAELDAGD